MKCLCCNKELDNSAVDGWHKACIKKFFNSNAIPTINISKEKIEEISLELVKDKKAVTGVQPKLSLGLAKSGNISRLTMTNYPLGYILKPNTKDFPSIAFAEHLVMQMAKHAKITTVPNALVKISDGEYAYITKRVDRDKEKKIHMEDFCQLSNRPTEYKYQSSVEKCMKIVDEYSSTGMLDKMNLFELVIFNYLTCNSDMHLKNYSLMETKLGNSLAPAYDLLPVNMIYPLDEDESALTINGKKRNITKNDFIKLAQYANLDIKASKRVIKRLCDYKDDFIEMINESFLDEEMKENFKSELSRRISTFDNLGL